MTTKICTGCLIEKDIDQYVTYNHSDGHVRYRSHCNPCLRIDWTVKNRRKRSQYKREGLNSQGNPYMSQLQTAEQELEAFYTWERPDFYDQAACKGFSRQEVRDPENQVKPIKAFFPDHATHHSLVGKSMCAYCPVRRDCLTHALEKEPYGIWGGLTEKERKKGIKEGKTVDELLAQYPLTIEEVKEVVTISGSSKSRAYRQRKKEKE